MLFDKGVGIDRPKNERKNFPQFPGMVLVLRLIEQYSFVRHDPVRLKYKRGHVSERCAALVATPTTIEIRICLWESSQSAEKTLDHGSIRVLNRSIRNCWRGALDQHVIVCGLLIVRVPSSEELIPLFRPNEHSIPFTAPPNRAQFRNVARCRTKAVVDNFYDRGLPAPARPRDQIDSRFREG